MTSSSLARDTPTTMALMMLRGATRESTKDAISLCATSSWLAIYIYFALLLAMVAGRLVWGVVQFACMGFDTSRFNLAAFWAGAVANAVPGIILQIIIIPVAVMLFEKIKPER